MAAHILECNVACQQNQASSDHNVVDPTLCLRHLVWTADRLRKVEGFDAYCSRLGLNPDCVAQHIVFDGYYNVQAVIKLGVEEVYGAYIAMFSLPIVTFDRE